METAKQITVFLENKPGRLANILAELAHQKINITALSVMDRTEHNVLRLVADDPAKTVRIIQGLSTPCTETDVLLVELRNQPGALAHVCGALAAEHIHIEPAKKYFINAGSVGQPRDGNWRAGYCIYDVENKFVELLRVKYDLAAAQKKIVKAGLPRLLAERLAMGR